MSEKQRDRRSKDDLELVVGMTQSLNYRLIKPAFSPPYNEVGYADEDNESHAVTEASRLIEKPKYFHQVTRFSRASDTLRELIDVVISLLQTGGLEIAYERIRGHVFGAKTRQEFPS